MDDSSHPFVNGLIKCHPILDDSSHPFVNGIQCHPIMNDSSHDDTTKPPTHLDTSPHPESF